MPRTNWTDYSNLTTEAYASIRGFRVMFVANGNRDGMVVSHQVADSDEEAIAVAVCAAREGYPVGNIDWTSCENGRWIPMGGYATEDKQCIYIN